MANFLSSCASCFCGCFAAIARVLIILVSLAFIYTSVSNILSRPDQTDDDSLLDNLPAVMRDNSGAEFRRFLPPLVGLGLLLTAGLSGLYGSCMSEPRSLKLFAFLLAIFACIAAYQAHLRSDTSIKLNSFNSSLKNAFPFYKWGSDEHHASRETKEWDAVQRELHCCGLKSPFEWSNAMRPSTASAKDLPKSCCHRSSSDETPCRLEFAHETPCLVAFYDYLTLQWVVFTSLASFFAFLACLTLCVASATSKSLASARSGVASYSQVNGSVYTYFPQAPTRHTPSEKASALVPPNAPPSYTFR